MVRLATAYQRAAKGTKSMRRFAGRQPIPADRVRALEVLNAGMRTFNDQNSA